MPDDHVGTVGAELLYLITKVPKQEPKDLYVEAALETMFGSHDWSRSFHAQQTIIYDEVLPVELLIIIHKWLRRKCANIENICLVVTHHLGIKTWWQQWCDLNHEKSFSIKEIFFANSPNLGKKYFRDIPSLPTVDWYRQNKSLSRLFSFYGGAYPSNDRQYLLLKVCEFADIAEIEYMGKFYSKQQILDYAEHILYFGNQEEIDYLATAYDTHVNPDLTLRADTIFANEKTRDERLRFNARQWEVDRHCWASVVRETINNDVYSCVTEKTLRAFLHHVAVIPVGFRAVHYLEQLGFWFPHAVVDYSYQEEKLFSTRINGLINSIKKMSLDCSLQQLNDFYIDNIQKFQHNANLIYRYLDQQESHS